MNNYSKDRFTVLHIFSGDLWAGAEVMIFNLLDQLKDNSDLKIMALSLNEGILTSKLRDLGVEVYSIPESIYSFPNIFLKALTLFKRKEIDLIHSHRHKENLLAFLLAKSQGVKRLVTTLHGMSEPSPSGQNGRNPISLKRKMNYFILRHYFTRVVTVSREMKRVLIQEYPFKKEKVDVIYNGIKIPKLTGQRIDQSIDHHFHIGTVGRMVPVKDFNLFLEVAAELKRQMDKVRFSILGEGPLKEQLVQRAKDLQIDDSVQFLSPRPDPFPYYLSLDLYINTSAHEGIPISILEAMACERPVVASMVGGIPEIISHGEHGLIVDTREPKKFVQQCLRIIEDKKLRVTIGKNASERIASCFSSSKMADAYRSLYYNL
ncbi:MAG: hypothetical protein A2W05_08850 [Candidatus Schekmanbacteria bacterium RBG_16_38_10]|uniref:Uncharacterized protein n=1 Tax=Candidatus Schekmanbacteria bacterium RBG_16_38_10 TaxID=1817879 RepID=A0A1F7RNH6_9BACT|nr:MAG: hypothetical protein A2W05_08850 [Candidatus Schekmanbacteria bacterium RBG_16_38_10]